MVADGNFCADHVKARKPEDDIQLTNGSGFMVEDNRYQKHLETAIEIKEVILPYSDELYR